MPRKPFYLATQHLNYSGNKSLKESLNAIRIYLKASTEKFAVEYLEYVHGACICSQSESMAGKRAPLRLPFATPRRAAKRL
jgi:hypothetical protein